MTVYPEHPHFPPREEWKEHFSNAEKRQAAHEKKEITGRTYQVITDFSTLTCYVSILYITCHSPNFQKKSKSVLMWMLVIKENNIKHEQVIGASQKRKKERNNHPKDQQ